MKPVFLLILLVVVLSSCNGDGPQPALELLPEPVMSPEAPKDAQVSKMGVFTSYAHNLAGKSTLYVDDDTDKKVLRLEEFTMIQGPDVYIFLSKSNNYSMANALPIAKLTEGYNNASLHLNIDPSIEVNIQKFVLVYCVQYNSLFGYTELK